MKSECRVPRCDWKSPESPNHHVAGCFATWHVYEDHPDIWAMVVGDRPPVDTDPRTPVGMAMAMVEADLQEMLEL